MRKIVVRTAGGIGNQLFQLNAAIAFAIKYDCQVSVVHDYGYKPIHCQFRTKLLSYSFAPLTRAEAWISRMRITKILQRLGRSSEIIKIGDVLYLDGYFQDESFWRIMKPYLRLDTFEKRSTIDREYLLHVRLGDFYKNDEERLSVLADRLRSVQSSCHLMTNSEELFSSELGLDVDHGSVELIATSDYSPDELLLLMSRYRVIDSNESTLAFWAAVVSGSELFIHNERLQILYELFKES